MKLLIALALAAAPSGLAMAPYIPDELNGCNKPCTEVITISSTSSFPTVESDKCYEVDGTFPSSTLTVRNGVDCAKITVRSGSSLGARPASIAHGARPRESEGTKRRPLDSPSPSSATTRT